MSNIISNYEKGLDKQLLSISEMGKRVDSHKMIPFRSFYS